jgi:formyltetrahydrofolate-dependent phosphoribosylglycinamide formyltransferase
MKKLAILISGRGTNMDAIFRKIEEGLLPASVSFIATDNPDSPGLAKARKAGFRTEILPYRTDGRNAAEEHLTRLITETSTEWIVLAGFMKILSSSFVNLHKGRIINIHPALLPSFPGAHGIEDAWNYGVKVTGVTVHLVDEEVDHGIILAQEPVMINDGDTMEDLEKRIHEIEHQIYWKTLKKVISTDEMKIEGRRALID